ncbi:tripartite tricarboxylate transporter permease [Proteiniclasticum sp. BAD-10]|uniref:Tripartite tricarboxylate transporter permease n=1 Tax=Proteiniclasticum sediminis TaxID=2804028 RepID=A0A941CPH3_9CLOT|nr:tripartite tricarboxylate transporter permease [Proteiniclasticum sediminis]MBR0575013.1 tripartite tricarboxylate transporter permease [Proteiniclasticum sediminis]
MFEFGIVQVLVSLLGVVIGIIFGALPGMTATMAVAIFLPLTYAYDLGTSMYLLLGLYVGGISGGLVPAILINIPGTPSSVTTGFDGHPMAKRGEGVRALRIGITASLMGGIISLIVLALFTPILADLAIKFSAVEKFLIILFSLTIIAALSKGKMTLGIFAGFLGVFISLMGIFPDNQTIRMVPTMFRTGLRDGFQLLPVLIGLFAFSQLFEESELGMKQAIMGENVLRGEQTKKFHIRDFKGQLVNVFRSSSIGTFMGILPGIGGSAASLLAYSQAKTWSKEPEKLGTGAVEGLVASESSNNGLTGGALVPLLSLGIPGDSTTAVLVGAFMLQGVQVGPLFITQNPVLWNTILFALFLANILMFLVMFYPIKYLANIIKIPKARLYPAIILLCVVGAFSTRSGNLVDVITLLIFGIVGYIFAKLGVPVTTFLIGFILGRDLEKYFIDSLKGSGGSLSVFFSRPIGNWIWVLILASLAYAFYDNRRYSKQQKMLAEKTKEAIEA